MNKPLKVLGLFDGMSCGQIALERAGFTVDTYYASEIDKHAITVTLANYPKTVQLGDVTKVTGLDVGEIDLLIGGSPCQGFSFAGKQLNFEDPRSKLFFEFVRLLNETKPKYFLLENVKMKKESEDVISSYLGVKPIEINSALVSAQNRRRLYWTNIPNVSQPEDKGILLRDILENGTPVLLSKQKTVCRESGVKSTCLLARDYKGFGNQEQTGVLVAGRIVGRRIGEDGKRKDNDPNVGLYQRVEINANPEKTNCLTTVDKDNILVGMALDINGHDILKRVYSTEGKSTTLTAQSGGNREKKVAISDFEYRKLTPLECERLQTVPENYTAPVSNTQRYRMLGNGWTVDVIAHIFKNMNL
jgi:DNA (cytosine-5)-methyltransferase 3A